MKKIVAASIALLLLSACSSSVYVENDKATKTQYVKLKLSISDNQIREPYYRQELTFVKETDRTNEVKFTLYDVVTLSEKSFDIDKENILLIIDDNIYTLENDYDKQISDQSVVEKKGEILKADSTKATVVTGYDVVKNNVNQMIHPLPTDVVEQIPGAKEVTLQYKVGPDFLNSEIKGRDLRNLKVLINK